MDRLESIKTRPNRVFGTLGTGVYVLCLSIFPMAVLEWYLHHSRDASLYIGMLLFVGAAVIVGSIYTLLIILRRRRLGPN